MDRRLLFYASVRKFGRIGTLIMQGKVLKTFRFFLSRFFAPPFKILITPEKIILFKRESVPIFFQDLDNLLSYLQEKRRSFLLYVEGFEQEVITEALPSLKSLERHSYLRHKAETLLEKASFVFMKKSLSEVSYLLQNLDFLNRFEEVFSFLRGVRCLSLELADQFQSPTLCRLVLSDHHETLIYARDQTLYLTRLIQGKDREAYDKTLRYIERQFHQSESTLGVKKLTLNEIQKSIWKQAESSFGIKVVSRESFRGPFYGRLGLKAFAGLMSAVSIFIGADLYQGWNEKEVLQQDLFALRNNLDQLYLPKGEEFSLSSAALDHFEKALKERGAPLENLELLAPLNSEGIFLKGLVWRRDDQENRAQVVFEICSLKKGGNNLGGWVRDTLLSKTSFLDIIVRDENHNDEAFEAEGGRQVCLMTEISSFEKSSNNAAPPSDAWKEE